MPRFLFTLIPSAVLALCLSVVDLPIWVESPGGARSVLPLITIDGAPTYGSDGQLLLTTVNVGRVNVFYALRAWADPAARVISEREILPRGVTDREYDRVSLSQMDQSKIEAARVVLGRVAGYPEEHGPGALIEFVGEGCPADGRLFPGDVILEVDGEAIDSAREASRSIDAVPVGRPVAFRIDADGEVRNVRVARGRCPGEEEALLGVVLVEAFPFEISIESGDVGGPSAGLMWALALYDLLTPGDLTRGRTIAGTGTIDAEGSVGPIGAVRDKVAGAQGVEADIMLVPRSNLRELRDVDLGELDLIAVSTFDDALEALRPPETSS